MTFAAWYDATVKPQLEETLKTMPVSAREALRTASRQAMAACWNAALEAAIAIEKNDLADNQREFEKLKT